MGQARPHEPQAYRGLANLLADLGRNDLALAYYELALGGRWDARFGDYRRIVGLEYLRFLRRVASQPQAASVPQLVQARLPRVAREFDLGAADLVVSITWNTDETDVDLRVIEPTGEECYYEHLQTRQGGELTTDVTQGYGPEMYVLRRAKPGVYRVRVKYFSSNRNRATTRTKVYATIVERWGTPGERRTQRVVSLVDGKEMHDVGELRLGGG